MNGTIFDDTKNVYEDQARVLFEYFKKAAEKIVSEEIEIEKQISIAEEEIVQLQRKLKSVKIRSIIMFILFFLIVTLIIGLIDKYVKVKNIEKSIQNKRNQIDGYKQAYDAIRRDYKVSKIGLLYVPIASQIPFDDKCILVDNTGYVYNKRFSLSKIRNAEKLEKNIQDLENKFKNIPIVETTFATEQVDSSEYSTSIQEITLYDYVGEFDRLMRTTSSILNDVDEINVDLPIISPDSEYAKFLITHSTDEVTNSAIAKIYDSSQHDDDVQALHEMNEMRKNLETKEGEYIEYFYQLMKNVASFTQFLGSLKMNSSNAVIDYSGELFLNSFKASFNHYSPLFEAEEIERIRAASFNYQDCIDEGYTPFALKQSSIVKYDLIAKNWVAEDGSRTSFPFGIHQIHEEIMMPVIHNLMAETRIKRLEIYNDIKNQKIDYLNQWHRDTDDFYGRNRSEANELMNRMRETFADYMASLNTFKTLKATEEQMASNGSLQSAKVNVESNQAQALLAFEAQAKQFQTQQEEFGDYMDRLKEEINHRAEEFGHIEYYEASLRDNESRQVAKSMTNLHDLESRRKILISAGSHVACYASLPPEPSVDASLLQSASFNLHQIVADVIEEIDNSLITKKVDTITILTEENSANADFPDMDSQVDSTINEQETKSLSGSESENTDEINESIDENESTDNLDENEEIEEESSVENDDLEKMDEESYEDETNNNSDEESENK